MLVRAAAVALAASLAVPSAASAKSPKELEQEARQKAADALQQRQLGQAQAQHEQGTAAPLSDAQRSAIGEVWTRNQLSGEVAALAAKKAKAQEVKNLGQWLANDAGRVSQDLGKLLQQRGTNPATLPPGPDRDRIQGEIGQLAKLSGDQFDQSFVDFVNRNLPTFKDAAGRARDATPGSDADLKWYLDQVERLEIGHRDGARQLAAQRQARTPPPQGQRPAPAATLPRPPGAHEALGGPQRPPGK